MNKQSFANIPMGQLNLTKKDEPIIASTDARAIHISYSSATAYNREQGLSDELVDLCERLSVYISECSSETNKAHIEASLPGRTLRNSIEKEGKLNPKVGAVLARATDKSERYEIYACCRGAFDMDNHAEYSLINAVFEGEENPKFGPDDYFFTTLEPCTQNSRNKWSRACAKVLIEREIQHLYIGLMDPNVLITGRGYYQLFRSGKEHPIEITPYKYAYRQQLCISNQQYLCRFSDIYPVHKEACRDAFLSLERLLSFEAIEAYVNCVAVNNDSDERIDLDQSPLHLFCFFEDMLMRRYLLPTDGKYVGPYYPTNDFALCFMEKPNHFVVGSTILITDSKKQRHQWNHPISLFYDGIIDNTNEDPYQGSFIEMMIEEKGYYTDLIEWKKVSGTKRKEAFIQDFFRKFNLSPEITREAIVNALVHRDYSSGLFTEIIFSDSHLIIKNPLPSDWKRDRINKILEKKAPSNPTTPSLMRLFMDMKATEHEGYGMATFKEFGNAISIDYDEPYLIIRIPFYSDYRND